MIDVDGGDPIQIRSSFGPAAARSHRQATQRWQENTGLQQREGESTVFVMFRLPGMQTSVERSVTDGKEAERSSTDEVSECWDENQHNVRTPLLCMLVHYSLGPFVPENLSDECLARVGLALHRVVRCPPWLSWPWHLPFSHVSCEVRVFGARLDCGVVSVGTRAPSAVLERLDKLGAR